MTALIIAYIFVVPLVSFCLTAGSLLGGILSSFLFIWLPAPLRTRISSIIGGITGVACAIAYGYGIFRLLVGPDSFTTGPFMATTIPLIIPISNDINHARRCSAALPGSRHVLSKSDIESIAPAPWGMVTGEIIGVIIATLWHFSLISF